MPKNSHVTFGKIVEDESSWVQRYSYDPRTQTFTYFTQAKPFHAYQYKLGFGQYLSFIQIVEDSGSWGSAISNYINKFPSVNRETRVIETLDKLREELSGNERNLLVAELDRLTKKFLTLQSK